ncbi:fungal-specific transcription factor domain-containing protein [Podospora didyma]|uniref:Fungal-specific transcription factor domain-containing protein n=1 Tax=Podospora didyma TaxID=330526 RepID=A0AAE0K0U9_9PEZI|nr:fungal-specific transcription factor domain-containing protein [Podospora didyma]
MPPKRKAPEVDSPSGAALSSSSSKPAATAPTPQKRQRVSRACDQCRAAREKCDGVRPTCSSCVWQNRACTYEINPKKRGVPTGYIRALELALACVFEKVAGTEDALNTILSTEGGQGYALLAGKDATSAERLHKRWRRSRVHKRIDGILNGDTDAMFCSPDKRSPSEDASDVEDSALRASPGPGLAAGSQSFAPTPSVLDTASEHDSMLPEQKNLFAGNPNPRTQSQQDMSRDYPNESSSPPPRRLKLPPNHWRLLDIYFSYTHSWLPILEKQDIFQASYLYQEQGLVLSHEDPTSAVHAELWSALALASFQDASCSKSASSAEFDIVSSSPVEVYAIARSLIPSENGPFRVHHTRALLLLGLVNLGQGNLTSAWILTGLSTRILLDSGTSQPSGQDREQQRLQSAMIACFMIDTIISIRYNKPPHLKIEDIDAVLPISEDVPDQWEPWTPCEGFSTSFAGSRVSRSPAYCRATFNQLFRILKVVAREVSARSCELLRHDIDITITKQLRHAIDSGSQFGDFTTSVDLGSASVPTAYLIRTVYLWAGVLLGSQIGSSLGLIKDTLDQYQARFGAGGMPPFLSTCIVSLASQETQMNSPGNDRAQLEALVSTYSPIWIQERRLSSGAFTAPRTTHQMTQSASRPLNEASSNWFSSLLHPSEPFVASSRTASHYMPTTATLPSQVNNSSIYGSFDAPGFEPNYHRGPGILQASPATLQHSNAVGLHIGAMSTSVMGASHRSHLGNPSTFGGSQTANYEALLENLASIECTDAVDVDPQFMVNLGFAPGCDLSEIMARGFGGL